MRDLNIDAEWTSRNAGYLDGRVQKRLGSARVLIAGCGLGSVVAELLARTGCTDFVLADGDRIEVHNLNRQMYSHADLGSNKAEALAARLRAIHPLIQVRAIPEMLNERNLAGALEGVDCVVDSIDFLDANAILALHRQARAAGVTVISPVAAGWGAAAFVFEPGGVSLEDLVGSGGPATEGGVSYAALFATVLERYSEALPPYVSEVVRSQFHRIRERQPCPISQLGSGTFSAAALTVSLLVRLWSDESVPAAPLMLQIDPMLHARACAPAGLKQTA